MVKPNEIRYNMVNLGVAKRTDQVLQIAIMYSEIQAIV